MIAAILGGVRVSWAQGVGAGSGAAAGSDTGSGLASASAAAGESNSSNADFQVPELTGPVVDEADLLRPNVARALSRGLRNLKAAGGSQINVLTVPTLGRDSIEQASIKVTDKWKLGGAADDRGVLLLVAPNERKVRIEVGQGLEGDLTDAYSNRIVQDSILPLFRSGDYDQGVLAGVVEIIKKTDPNVDLQKLFGERVKERSSGKGSGRWIFYLIGLIILISLFSGGGGGRRRGRYSNWGAGALGYGLGSLGGGGGWGGGSSGGGGWGGGGGGFSGGGASGGW